MCFPWNSISKTEVIDQTPLWLFHYVQIIAKSGETAEGEGVCSCVCACGLLAAQLRQGKKVMKQKKKKSA